MKIVKNIFLDIRYEDGERAAALKQMNYYLTKGYEMQSDCDDNVIQLLRTQSFIPAIFREVKE